MGETQRQLDHHVTLEKRSRAAITGVNEVCSFHENEIVLKVDSGMMIIDGEGLHVGKLLIDEGQLDVEGKINGLHYEHPHQVKKLFNFLKKI